MGLPMPILKKVQRDIFVALSLFLQLHFYIVYIIVYIFNILRKNWDKQLKVKPERSSEVCGRVSQFS